MKFGYDVFVTKLVYKFIITKMYILGKKINFNSECQPYHKYQQTGLLPLISNHLTQKTTNKCTLDRHILVA